MESPDEVKLLLIRPSPFAMSCALALREKGVQFQEVEENLRNKSELLLRSNPVYKQIPVLLHNGRAVSQSLVICEYIEEAWPTPSLLPDSPYERALARFWADYINKKFMVTGLKLLKKFGEEHETTRKDVVEQFVTLDKAMSAEGPFFFGDKMSLADVALAPLVPWMASFEALGELKFPDAQECSHMHRWLATMRANANVVASLPNSSEFLEYTTNMRRRIAEKFPKGL
uniref:glutathione transferase n=1 Tax=Wollemia nobilis TaxID=56998 RepID=A0A0C9RTV3_9CONI